MADEHTWGLEIDAAIRELATADTLAFGGVGFASQTLPATEAYRLIERLLPERAEDLRSRLVELVARGSPAGRAYAATLLGRFDPAAARATWRSMVGDRSEFTTFTGCVMGRTTLGEYAAERLRPDPE